MAGGVGLNHRGRMDQRFLAKAASALRFAIAVQRGGRLLGDSGYFAFAAGRHGDGLRRDADSHGFLVKAVSALRSATAVQIGAS